MTSCFLWCNWLENQNINLSIKTQYRQLCYGNDNFHCSCSLQKSSCDWFLGDLEMDCNGLVFKANFKFESLGLPWLQLGFVLFFQISM